MDRKRRRGIYSILLKSIITIVWRIKRRADRQIDSWIDGLTDEWVEVRVYSRWIGKKRDKFKRPEYLVFFLNQGNKENLTIIILCGLVNNKIEENSMWQKNKEIEIRRR